MTVSHLFGHMIYKSLDHRNPVLIDPFQNDLVDMRKGLADIYYVSLDGYTNDGAV